MNFCPNCGTKLPENAVFCSECGKPLVETAQPQPPAKPKKKLPISPKKLLIIAAVALAVFLVVRFIDGLHCQYSSCDNAAVKGSDYCYNHKCAIDSCDSAKAYNSKYCYYHKGLYEVVESASSTNLKFTNVTVTHNSSYTVATGTVTNNGTKKVTFVKIKGAFTNSAGTTLDTDWTYAVGSEGLDPGESTTFRMSVSKNSSIKNCKISIID